MSKYNLDNYETVKERKKRFYKDHPEGRIIVELLNKGTVLEYALFRAMLYIDGGDEFPKSIGYAMELRDTELSTSKSGHQYASVNYTSWLENAEESAVGRCLDNAGYAGNDKCSREEMEKVERVESKQKVTKDKTEADSLADQVEREFSKPGVIESKPATGAPKPKGRLDFIEVRAKLEDLDTLQKVDDYRKDLWQAHPKMSEKQVTALKSIFQEREAVIKSQDQAVEQTMFGENS